MYCYTEIQIQNSSNSVTVFDKTVAASSSLPLKFAWNSFIPKEKGCGSAARNISEASWNTW